MGEKVWLSTKNLNIPGTTRKLSARKIGPMTITKVMGPVTYQLKLPEQWKIHNVFHASLLSPYRENDYHGPNENRPPPDIIEGEEQWEVEAIISHKGMGTRRRYLIKWKGYGNADRTWEPEKHLTGATKLLQKYKRRHHL